MRSQVMWIRSKKRLRLAAGFVVMAGITLFAGLYAYQRPFREYPGIEYNDFPLPPDAYRNAEFTFARLMYPPYRGRMNDGFGFRLLGDWTRGGTMWTQDYPRADRHFMLALRRLTRVDARSVEQPVNLDDGDDVFNWPWLYAVQVGQWQLTDHQAAKLREYLQRGGFFMGDDFWGPSQWKVFMETMQRVFPDKSEAELNVELEDSSPIFHSVYDLDHRYQVAGARYITTGYTEKCENCPPFWNGISDDKGRVQVALTVDSDVGDSWEWADDPRYDEKFSALGIRIGVNYIVYAMTH